MEHNPQWMTQGHDYNNERRSPLLSTFFTLNRRVPYMTEVRNISTWVRVLLYKNKEDIIKLVEDETREL